MDQFLTVSEVAEILKVKEMTVREMFRTGRLRGFKIGKSWRMTLAMLNEDLDAMRQAQLNPAAMPHAEKPSSADDAAPKKRRGRPKKEESSAPQESASKLPKETKVPPVDDSQTYLF